MADNIHRKSVNSDSQAVSVLQEQRKRTQDDFVKVRVTKCIPNSSEIALNLTG